MCVNCVSNAEVALGTAGVVAAAVTPTARRVLASFGIGYGDDRRPRDAHTIAFLESLDLDPVAILGHDVVVAARSWKLAQAGAARPTLGSILSHRRLATA